jgi:hypothetical protein
MKNLRRKYKYDMTMRMLAAAILACLDKVVQRDPSVGIYYEDGKVVKKGAR